jgi:hypothetical protein
MISVEVLIVEGRIERRWLCVQVGMWCDRKGIVITSMVHTRVWIRLSRLLYEPYL